MRPFTLNLLVVCIGLSVLPLANAQYKYEEPGKNITYSDLPPPPNAKLLKLNNLPVSESRNSNLPFDLQQAASNFPVILYTSTNCSACDEARNYLRNRGIPYSEKTVKSNEDIDVLKRYSPEGSVPVLLVGKRKDVGFSSTSWSELLSEAGYPVTSKLPSGYQFAEAESAAPTTTAATPGNTSGNAGTSNRNARSPQTTSAPTGSAPPGFKF